MGLIKTRGAYSGKPQISDLRNSQVSLLFITCVDVISEYFLDIAKSNILNL